MSINRGDIFYVNPSETVGSEQRSGRPAIIVSNPLCNEHSPVVEVVYLTCQYKKPMPTHVRIESAGKRSTALCEQISSVDVSRLGDFKGHLTDREMAQVDVALMASLDLHPIPRQAKVRPVVPDVENISMTASKRALSALLGWSILRTSSACRPLPMAMAMQMISRILLNTNTS